MVTTTEKIVQIVEDAKKEMKKAEEKFAAAGQYIQSMASNSISFDQMNRAAAIVAEGRRMVTELYSSYEALVRIVDGRAKPLLEEDPKPEAVKAVADLLKRINAESSSISVDFSASLNSSHLGDVGVIKSTASVEAIVIQKFWEDHYRNMPAVIAAEKEKVETQKRLGAKKTKALKTAKEELDTASKDSDSDRAEKSKHKKAVSREGDDRVAEYEKQLNGKLEEMKVKAKKENKRKIAKLTEELAQNNQKLASLGFFKFSEKKATKETIAALLNRKEYLESGKEIDCVINKLEEKKQSALKQYRADIDSYLSKRFSSKKITVEKMVDVPERTGEPESDLELGICDLLDYKAPLFITDMEQMLGIQDTHPVMKAIFSLQKKGLVVRTSNGFVPAGYRYTKKVTLWEENPDVAKAGFPKAIEPEIVFQ